MPELRFTIWYCIFNDAALVLLFFPQEDIKGMTRKISAKSERKTVKLLLFFLNILIAIILIMPKSHTKPRGTGGP